MLHGNQTGMLPLLNNCDNKHVKTFDWFNMEPHAREKFVYKHPQITEYMKTTGNQTQ
jgi:hypothetical protein